MISPRALFSTAAAAGLAAAARAQSFTNDSHIALPLTWREVNSAGQPITGPSANGILEPGEYALLSVTPVSFTNQFAIANFSPPLVYSSGRFNSGQIIGLGTAFFDLLGQPGLGGTQGIFNNQGANGTGTSGYGVRGQWRLVDNGTINAGRDSIINIEPGQAPPRGPYNTSDPITNLFRALWQPDSFAPRTVNFHLAAAAPAGNEIGAVVVEFASGFFADWIYVNPQTGITFGSINIPIAPAPPGLALLALAAPIAARRRRTNPLRKENQE